MMHRPVFHQHGREREVVFFVKVMKDSDIVLATIVEDAPLYLAVAHVGIVVEVFQPLFRTVVQCDILLHLVVVVGQSAPDVDGKCQTDVAVELCFGRECTGVHIAQVADQTVVAADFGVGVGDIVAEGCRIVAKLPILFRGGVAGIGKVENVALLLGIEHQSVLLALVVHGEQLFDDHLLLDSQVVLLFVEVMAIGVELLTQDG